MPSSSSTRGIAAAIILDFIGCACLLWMSLLAVLGLLNEFILRGRSTDVVAYHPSVGRTVGGIGVYVSPAAWGSITGFGLLKLRAWARTSILVFSMLVIFISASGALEARYLGRRIPLDPATPNFQAVKIVLLGFAALANGIAIWWLIYFNLKGVRARFVAKLNPRLQQSELEPRL